MHHAPVPMQIRLRDRGKLNQQISPYATYRAKYCRRSLERSVAEGDS